jgi:hypothetical protein
MPAGSSPQRPHPSDAAPYGASPDGTSEHGGTSDGGNGVPGSEATPEVVTISGSPQSQLGYTWPYDLGLCLSDSSGLNHLADFHVL